MAAPLLPGLGGPSSLSWAQRLPGVSARRPGTLLPGGYLQSKVLPARPLTKPRSHRPGPAHLQDAPGELPEFP